jgi:hypothetical protein
MRALELRISGATFEQIATLLGYADHAGARKAVLTALPKTREERGNELRQIERERLRALWLAMFPLAQRGDVKAAAVCCRLLQRKAQMEGLDRPRRLRIKGSIDARAKGPVIKVYGGFSPDDLIQRNGTSPAVE